MIAITPEKPAPNQSQRLKQLSDTGFDMLHLRHPGLDANGIRRQLDCLDAGLLHKVWLHGYPELVEEYGLGGLHLGRRCPDAPSYIRHLGISLHTVSELAEVEYGQFDYVTYSPVYASISKPGYAPSAEGLSCPPCAVPVIALGGVTFDRLPELKRLGYRGAAMLGSLWNIQ